MPAVVSRLWFVWSMAWTALFSVLMILPGWAAYLLRPTTRRYWRWMRAWSRLVMGTAGHRLAVTGQAPDGPAVYVANHQGMVDIPAVLRAIPRPILFLSRITMRRLPIVSTVLTHSRNVFVDFDAPEAGLAEAAARLAEGESLFIWPEGTRNYGGRVRRFLPGAFQLAVGAGLPVVPVAIDGSTRVMEEHQMRSRPGLVRVHILPALTGDEPADLSRRARAAIVAALPPPSDRSNGRSRTR